MQLEGFWLPRWRSNTEAHIHLVKKILFSTRSNFQQIEIVELDGYGKSLILDGIHQFAEADEFIYQEAIVHPPLCLHPSPNNILIIGAGGGNALREVVKHPTVQSVDVIDIDRLVVEKCKEFIGSDKGAYEDPRVRLIIADGREYVKSTEKKYDCILVDSTTPKPGSVGYGFYDITFFEAAWNILNDKGMLCGLQSSANLLFLDTPRTIRFNLEKVFSQVISYMVYCPFYALSHLLTISVKNSSVDPLDTKTIITKLKLINQGTRFYDENSHVHMFVLPKYIREKIFFSGNIVDQEDLIKY